MCVWSPTSGRSLQCELSLSASKTYAVPTFEHALQDWPAKRVVIAVARGTSACNGTACCPRVLFTGPCTATMLIIILCVFYIFIRSVYDYDIMGFWVVILHIST
jgi:hypothetical protein